MSVMMLVAWILAVLVAAIAFSFVTKIVLKVKNSVGFVVIMSVIELVASVGCGYLAIASSATFAWRLNGLLVVLYVVLGANAVGGILMALASLFIKRDGGMRFVNAKVKRIVSLVLVVALLAFGTVNMQVISPDSSVYYSDKIENGHMFVFVSDLHAGSPQLKSTIDKMLKEIKIFHPEFIVLGGDITDEYSDLEDVEWIYGAFGSTGIPTYFVYGNHDRQASADKAHGRTYTDEQLKAVIESNGIVILEDQVVNFADDLCLIGRDDISDEKRLPVGEMPTLDKSKYNVILEHQPYNYSDTEAMGADLQVSGHSHAGQYFPMELLYNLAGYDAYGDYTVGSTTLHVGAGTGGWYVPFRTARGCMYDMIVLLPTDM